MKIPPEKLISVFRAQRGLSKRALHVRSEVAESMIRLIERGAAGDVRDGTWRLLIHGLATATPISRDEAIQLAESLGWTVETVETISDAAIEAIRPTDQRQTPRSRIVAVLESHPDQADQIARFAEEIARLLDEAKQAAKQAAKHPPKPPVNPDSVDALDLPTVHRIKAAPAHPAPRCRSDDP